MKHAVITAVFGIGMVLLLSGCANPDSAGNKEPVFGYGEPTVQKKEYDDGAAQHIAALYQDIYENALQDGTTGSLEMIRSCVEGLGEKGYAAVDDSNQINMTNPQQVEDFCKAAREKVPSVSGPMNGSIRRKAIFCLKGSIIPKATRHFCPVM